MKLDLRRPTLVMAGAWNPAIFQPPWIARHVFDMASGVEFPVRAVQQASGEQKVVFYIDDVGFSVSPSRLELFAVDVGDSAFNAVENVIAKIVELLPHTPVSAYGINFCFIEELSSPDLLKKIKSYDGLEERFKVTKETIASVIDLDPKVQLKIQRQRQGSNVVFNFNFHRSEVESDSFKASIHGNIQERLDQTLSIMRDIYGLSSYEVLMHEFDSTKGEEEYADAKKGT